MLGHVGDEPGDVLAVDAELARVVGTDLAGCRHVAVVELLPGQAAEGVLDGGQIIGGDVGDGVLHREVALPHDPVALAAVEDHVGVGVRAGYDVVGVVALAGGVGPLLGGVGAVGVDLHGVGAGVPDLVEQVVAGEEVTAVVVEVLLPLGRGESHRDVVDLHPAGPVEEEREVAVAAAQLRILQQRGQLGVRERQRVAIGVGGVGHAREPVPDVGGVAAGRVRRLTIVLAPALGEVLQRLAVADVQLGPLSRGAGDPHLGRARDLPAQVEDDQRRVRPAAGAGHPDGAVVLGQQGRRVAVDRAATGADVLHLDRPDQPVVRGENVVAPLAAARFVGRVGPGVTALVRRRRGRRRGCGRGRRDRAGRAQQRHGQGGDGRGGQGDPAFGDAAHGQLLGWTGVTRTVEVEVRPSSRTSPPLGSASTGSPSTVTT